MHFYTVKKIVDECSTYVHFPLLVLTMSECIIIIYLFYQRIKINKLRVHQEERERDALLQISEEEGGEGSNIDTNQEERDREIWKSHVIGVVALKIFETF